MDLQTLERAAEIVFEICRTHPEICPHDYDFRYSKLYKEDGKREVHYTCRLCGKEDIEIKNER